MFLGLFSRLSENDDMIGDYLQLCLFDGQEDRLNVACQLSIKYYT